MQFAFEVINVVRKEEPELFNDHLHAQIYQMLDEAVIAETQFAEDLLSGGVSGLSVTDVNTYLKFVADQRLSTLNLPRKYNTKNPFAFLDLQDVQEVTNFFERRVSAYQVGIEGEIDLNAKF